jgi:hypothetical protein
LNIETAPIVLFAYNRPLHTRKTVKALQGNKLSHDSRLIIYSDAPKDDSATQGVAEVRNYLRTVNGFKDVAVIERDTNWGLSRSIISGVTEITREYGNAIVLEDDIVTSPHFLKFMNEALDFYRHNDAVWHISGWNYPIESRNPQETFLWRVMNCWGWATWADRWSYFEKDGPRLAREWNNDQIKQFNLDGVHNFWSQVEANNKGDINTWAIFWYATIFKKHGLCLNPSRTLVDNIGHDGYGVHCGNKKSYVDDLNPEDTFNFPKDLYESTHYLKEIKRHLHTPLTHNIKRHLPWI